MLTIPAITLWQPWASWIAMRLKTIETRGHGKPGMREMLGPTAALVGQGLADKVALPTVALWAIRPSGSSGRFGLPGGVMVTQEVLVLLFLVRVQAG